MFVRSVGGKASIATNIWSKNLRELSPRRPRTSFNVFDEGMSQFTFKVQTFRALYLLLQHFWALITSYLHQKKQQQQQHIFKISFIPLWEFPSEELWPSVRIHHSLNKLQFDLWHGGAETNTSVWSVSFTKCILGKFWRLVSACRTVEVSVRHLNALLSPTCDARIIFKLWFICYT